MSESDSSPGDSADDSVTDTLRLCSVPGVGPRTRKKLLERFGSDRAVLKATSSQLREVSGVGSKLAEAISQADHQSDVEREVALPAARHRDYHRARGPLSARACARFTIRPA